MYKYFTKTFRYSPYQDVVASQIDDWLKSFERDVPAMEGNCAEVVGYVSLRNTIVITIKRWEIQNNG